MSIASTVPVHILGRSMPIDLPSKWTVDMALAHLVERYVEAKPLIVSLFGLSVASENNKALKNTQNNHTWLAPSQTMADAALVLQSFSNSIIQLRLRFKVPFPSKLLDLDLNAFTYAYQQVSLDLMRGSIIKSLLHASGRRDNDKWWTPIIKESSNDGNQTHKKVLVYSVVTQLVSLIMAVECIEQGKPVRDVVKEIGNFLPKEVWANNAEKLIGFGKLRSVAERLVDQYVSTDGTTSMDLRLRFLNQMELKFPAYYYQNVYSGVLFSNPRRGLAFQRVHLTLKPPFKSTEPPFAEQEPMLTMDIVEEMNSSSTTYSAGEGGSNVVCTIEDLCTISIEDEAMLKSNYDGCFSFELARKSGIPLHFKVLSRQTGLSIVSDLDGYYRLCEKYSFSLCPPLCSPMLASNLSNNIHGPLTADFVTEKFKQKSRSPSSTGTYLLWQSCDKFNLIFLHHQLDYVISVLNVYRHNYKNVFRLAALNTDNELEFDSLSALLKHLRDGGLKLDECLHPSEYDKSPTLLLCRSINKLRADLLGHEAKNVKEREKLIIPLNHLSRYEENKFSGKYTNVWRGMWHRTDNKSHIVAIKQLKTENIQMTADFLEVMYNAMLWDCNSLVQVFGTTLCSSSHSLAMVLEYFTLGPLDIYLMEKEGMKDVELVEACFGLANALWYLEENNFAHGNIRCSNVFVAQHAGNVFKVKLGDSGLNRDLNLSSNVHWLSLELLLIHNPRPTNCTIKSDVWALATTFWQIFNHGLVPTTQNGPEEARQMYIMGYRLPKPSRLTGSLTQLYQIMRECWTPTTSARKSPQAIVRDLNQVLYRVFNAKRLHTYIALDDNCTVGGEDSGVSSDDRPPSEGGSRNDNGVDNDQNSSTETIVSGQTDYLKNMTMTTTTTALSSLSCSSLSSSPVQSKFNRLHRDALVPTYTEMMRQRLKSPLTLSEDSTKDILLFNTSSSSNTSRPESSLEDTTASQFTSQTSLASFSTAYSMASIYQLSDESQLELNTEFPLGEGNFGVVYKGIMSRSDGEWDQVAVKMLKDSEIISAQAMEEMQRELNIMQSLRHDNIVRIKGVLNDDTKVMIIMEYVREGSLDRYLHVHKASIAYPRQLFTFAQNIVDGMTYLGQRGIIHRDLAARNILVENEELVKISDFGLARSVECDVYVMSSSTNIPVKWLALECLTHNKYSFASDTWSFGVTLWEMFEFGASPSLNGCEHFFKMGSSEQEQREDLRQWLTLLDEGVRLPQPENCPSSLYTEVMIPCWHRRPEERPSFVEIGQKLSKIELQVT